MKNGFAVNTVAQSYVYRHLISKKAVFVSNALHDILRFDRPCAHFLTGDAIILSPVAFRRTAVPAIMSHVIGSHASYTISGWLKTSIVVDFFTGKHFHIQHAGAAKETL